MTLLTEHGARRWMLVLYIAVSQETLLRAAGGTLDLPGLRGGLSSRCSARERVKGLCDAWTAQALSARGRYARDAGAPHRSVSGADRAA